MSASAGALATLSLALRLARREMRTGLRGFGIFLACLSLGVAAIAGVGSVSQAMLDGLGRDGRAILGGDLDLRMVHREASPEQRAFLEARGTVSEVADMRAMIRGTQPDARRTLIELRALDDAYPLYGSVALEPAEPLADALARRDGTWGAAVDAGLLPRLDLAVGDRVRIGEETFQIRATIVREPDRAAQFATFGPHVLIARESLAATQLVLPGSLIHYHYRLRLPPGGDVAAARQAINAAFPDAGWRIRGPGEGTPRITRAIERLTLFMTLVGLTALLVGGLGVANAVRAYLERRTATIATLKCLGASGRLIFLTYFAQVMALALLGVTLGLAAGAAAPALVAAALDDQLGWDLAVAFYPRPLLLGAAFGLLTAVVFSLWPLARARRTPAANLFRDRVSRSRGPRLSDAWVTAAAIVLVGGALAALAVAFSSDRWLALYFVLGALATLLVFRLMASAIMAAARRLPRPRRPGLRLALANLHRPGATTGSVVTSLGLGLTVLVAIALIQANLARQLSDELPDDAPGFYFIDIQPDQIDPFVETVQAVPGVQALRRVPMLRGRITGVNGVPTERLSIPPEVAWVFRGDRGLTWAAEPPEDATLVAGTWWPEDYAGPPLVSLDAEVGRALDIGPGDRIGINVLGRDIEVEIANLRSIDWSNLTINFVVVFSPGLLESAPQTYIATVHADPAAEDAVERAVTDRFANISSIRVKEALAAIVELLGHIAVALKMAAGVALVAGVLVLAGAIAAEHRRRVYDAVVMKVLGATRPLLASTFLAEFGLLGLLTAGIAAGVGSLAAAFVLTEVMELPFTFLPGTVFGTAILAAFITLAAGFAGTWRALGHKAAPLLRNE